MTTTRTALASALILAVVAASSCRERPAGAALVQSAYVWQRAWTPAVSAAVAQAPPELARLVVLAAQVDWPGGRPQPVRVPLDFAALKASGRPVGLALRIASRPEPLRADSPEVAGLCTLGRSLLDEARAHGLPPAELQVDYDCPERRLAEYAGWVSRLREAVRPVPLRVTVLPAWLRHRECRALLQRTDGSVLQVHSLQNGDAGPRLLDVREARAAVQSMGRLGVHFDVALPTYAYWVARDRRGAVRGVSAEGPQPNWPADVSRLERVRAPPAAIAGLVREWSGRRPATLDGLIWYRLPVADDAMNWAPATLAAVMRGQAPVGRALTLLQWRDRLLADVAVTNAGDDEVAAATLDIRVDLGSNAVAAADAVGGFTVQRLDRTAVRFVPTGEGVRNQVLRPGERRTLGWVRTEDRPREPR